MSIALFGFQSPSVNSRPQSMSIDFHRGTRMSGINEGVSSRLNNRTMRWSLPKLGLGLFFLFIRSPFVSETHRWRSVESSQAQSMPLEYLSRLCP